MYKLENKKKKLTCKVRHRVLNEQWGEAILAGQPKKADLPEPAPLCGVQSNLIKV
jgi:hypothetical protein